MRSIGTLHPTDGIEVQPDTATYILLASASAQSIDYPTPAPHLVRLTGITTGGAQLNFYANVNTTGAAVPTSGQTSASSGMQQPVLGQRSFQLVQTSAGATSFSVIAPTSGWVIAEFWKR